MSISADLKELSSFKQRLAYARTQPYVGQGNSRYVIRDQDFVYKIAKNKCGVYQIKAEIEAYSYFRGILCPIIEADLDNYTWVKMPYCTPAKRVLYLDKVSYPFSIIQDIALYIHHRCNNKEQWSFKYEDMINGFLEKALDYEQYPDLNRIVDQFYYIFGAYDLNPRETAKADSWGYLASEGPVLVDYGFNSETEKYYNSKKR